MNIDEKRLLILASPIARTTHAKKKDTILIKAEDFAKSVVSKPTQHIHS